MHQFIVQPLDLIHVRSAFPLVRQALPGMDIAMWCRYARRIGDPKRAHRSGIMIATRPARPVPVGLFFYHTERAPAHGTILVADQFVAMDILDHRPVIDAMVHELQALGHRLECVRVRAVVHNTGSEITQSLFAAGLGVESTTFSRTL